MLFKNLVQSLSVCGVTVLAAWTFGSGVAISEGYRMAFHPSEEVIASCGLHAHFQQMDAKYPSSHFSSFIESNNILECAQPHPVVVLTNDLYKTIARVLPSGFLTEEDLIAPHVVAYDENQVFQSYVQHRKEMGSSSWSHRFVALTVHQDQQNYGGSLGKSLIMATAACVVYTIFTTIAAFVALLLTADATIEICRQVLYPMYRGNVRPSRMTLSTTSTLHMPSYPVW